MSTTGKIVQPVEDGKVVDTTASGNSASKTQRKPGTLDKEAFLQLLVAQMKYQDPLEPTSNTEYISQLATFSSLEEMQNLNFSMQNMQASSLVGKQVVVKVTTEATGEVTRVTGRVDSTMREGNKTYLIINGSPYNIEDLESVLDDGYLDAVDLASTFKEAIAKLPDPKDLTLEHELQVDAAAKAFNAMSGYQQGFIDKDTLEKLNALLQRMSEMKKQAEQEKMAEGDAGKTEQGGAA